MASHVRILFDLKSGFAEGIGINIFRLDGMYVSSIARNLAGRFWFALSLKLVINFSRNMAE